MRIITVVLTLALAVAFVFIAGCDSLGGSNPSSSTAPAAGTQNTGSGHANPTTAKTNVPSALTDSQKSQAESLARANNTVKQDVLSKSYLKVTEIYADYPPAGSSDTYATVTFAGSDSAHSDPARWIPEQYKVYVDLTTNQVALVTYIKPQQLPTPAPK